MSISTTESTNATHAAANPTTETKSFAISRRVHWTILIISMIVIGLAMTMSIEGSEKVALPGMQSPLPELCHLKRVFHTPCPGCGLTRSFISMGHFDLLAAASYNVMGVPLFLLTLLQIPYRAYWLVRPDRRLLAMSGLRLEGALMVGMCVLLVAQWLVKMALGQLW